MVIHVRSEQDRRLLGHIRKKSKKKRVHVYYNKKDKQGNSKYIQGNFYSEKNKDNYPYKSSYELAFLHQLETNPAVVKYIYEPFELFYYDIKNNRRIYRPDFMVLYDDGSLEINEVKPKVMLKDFDVRSKAKYCIEYLNENFKEVSIKYRFITEQDLFSTSKEYTDFIKTIKG